MADTPLLPSREWVQRFCEGDFDGPIEHSEPWAVLDAYASGRLVDREAIDTVWVCVEKSSDSAGWRVTNMPGSPSSCYFSGGAHTPWCGDAALGVGDTDE